MPTLRDILETDFSDEWQLLHVDPIFKTALTVAPRGFALSDGARQLVSIPHCTIFAIIDGEIDCEIFSTPANHTPHSGLLNLLGRRLLKEPYRYAIIQKIS